MFLMAGFTKLSQPKAELSNKIGNWVDSMPSSTIKLIGLLELLGAIGLILPMLLHIMPILTPIAGIGLALTMFFAMVLHLRRKENKNVGMNVVLLALCIFIVIGRFSLVAAA